ncbi:MAG: metal-sulfur cluster assembly factor [Gillisia sp.]|nr:metal-sulfur cluster assembly factor [Gillisia sp.]
MNEITNNPIKYAQALEALKDVIDPEIGLNVVDLGLIYQIDFDEENSKINTVFTLTTQFCPMGESITEAVKRALENAFPLMEVDLDLTFDPAWNQEMISEAGINFLNQ